MRSAKLAAIGGVDYQPPAAMAIQLPPIRKVSTVCCLIRLFGMSVEPGSTLADWQSQSSLHPESEALMRP